MGISDEIKRNERIYNGVKDIKYLFYEGKNTDKLILTFPGFSSLGNPPAYNYIRTLKDSNTHKLFILDDHGPRGSYLIGQNRDNSIELSVMSLLSNLCQEYDIKHENIISQGSSKGGTCALYFGIKYGFGYAIAGGPQIRVGTYLSHAAPDVLDFIAGGRGKEDILHLDNILYDMLKIPFKKFPKIFIHVGRGDHHYHGHILPFLNKLDEKGLEYEMNISNYHSHTSLGHYYPDYLITTLNSIDKSIIDPKPYIQKADISFLDGALEVTCLAAGKKLEYSCEIHNADKIVKKTKFSKDIKYRYPINLDSIYRARVYVKEGEHINSKVTDEIQINNLVRGLEGTYASDIDIHGSSVSKYIFDFEPNSDITLGKYYAKQSIFSVVSNPFPDQFDINLSSPWEKNMLEMDLKKDFFNNLSYNHAKYLLLDLIDERNMLVKYKDIIFTFSDIIGKSRFLDGLDVEYINKFNLDHLTFENSVDLYISGLLEIYGQENIIIHETYLMDNYISKDGEIKLFPDQNIDYNKKVNALLKQYYTYLKYKLPNSEVINIHDKFMASENHIFGLSPIHYQEEYYREAFKNLKNIIVTRPVRTSAFKRFNKVFRNILRTSG